MAELEKIVTSLTVVAIFALLILEPKVPVAIAKGIATLSSNVFALARPPA